MLIETEIVFTDEQQSNIMGKDVNHTDIFLFDLNDVSGIMPGDKEGKTSIIFLCGNDLLINLPFSGLSKKYREVKESNLVMSNEG